MGIEWRTTGFMRLMIRKRRRFLQMIVSFEIGYKVKRT